MEKLYTGISIVISSVIFAIVAFGYVNTVSNYNEQKLRDEAVDGCMQNARYTWQEKRTQDPTLLNTTEEPNRFWYQLCMQEKGYPISIEL